MMKRLHTALACILTAIAAMSAATRTDSIIAELNNPLSKNVLVAVHRGDWRNHPENSLPAMQSAIDMGADIVEIDLALTADSVLVVCHDRTLDRTTTGHGLISDHTYAQLKDVRLRSGHSGTTDQHIPTLREAMELCKDRIVINIDKGYQYYDLVQRLSEEMGTTGQLLIKGGISPDDVRKKFASYPTNMMFMPILNPLNDAGQKLLAEYTVPTNVPVAVEVCWAEEKPAVQTAMDAIRNAGAKVWANTLWPSLNAGLWDDVACYGNPDDVYGALIGRGVTIIQTDRPALLLSYLRSKGLHD